MKNNKKGFTLVELVVSVALVAMISTIFIGSRSKYTAGLVLNNETYNLALMLREAQVNSLAVKGSSDDGNPTTFNTSYGMHISSDNLTQVRLFTDSNTNGKYDSGEINEIITMGNGVRIWTACGMNGESPQCFGSPASFRNIYITFKRPNSSSKIRFMNDGNGDINGVSAPAIIYITSPSGHTSTITIDSSGSMSIRFFGIMGG